MPQAHSLMPRKLLSCAHTPARTGGKMGRRAIMNVYAVIILSTLLLDYMLNLVADCYNLRALRHELPPEFADVYDAAAYRKSQEYTRVQTRFGILTSTCMLVV